MTQKARNEIKNGKSRIFAVIIGVLIVGVISVLLKDTLKNSFDPVSIAANMTSTELKETDGRTNVLVLGYDKRSMGTEGSQLTDTILVASIGKTDKDIVLISVPRDLWVKMPSGSNTKVNAVYAYEGADGVKKVLEDVLGLPIHYHVLVTFDLFTQAIDILGGVNVDVETAFEDYEYPIEGMEANSCGRTEEQVKTMNEEGKSQLQIFPCRYQHIKFNQGIQPMDGETALKYARSRHGNNNEGTDFARARRQQRVITAIKDKALSIQTLINPGKLKELYDLYSKNIDTNIDLGTIQNFYVLSQQISFDKVVSVVLDDRSDADAGGLLYHPEDPAPYGGQYVLVPQTGDYSQIHAFVQRYLFGNK